MNATDKNKDLKIAVIGAGPSGLTISHQLKKQGYNNVTVFEKNDRPGGKVLSIEEPQTGHMLEFGAVWLPFAYTTVRDLVKEFEVELIDAPNTQVTELNPARNSCKYMKLILSTISKSPDLKRYLKGRAELNPDFSRPGLDFPMHPDLAMNFNDYLKKHKIEALGDMFIPLDTGCGYGFAEEVPALYKLKFFDLVFKDIEMQMDPRYRGLDRQTKYVKKGYQEIWKQAARRQNVVYQASVEKITSFYDQDGQAKVQLTFKGKPEVQTFDRLFISSTGDHVSRILDGESLADEKELFSHVKTYPYYVSLFKARGLDARQIGVSLLHENATVEKAGHPTILSAPCPHLNDELYMNWSVSRHELDDDEVERRLIEDIERLGGTYHGQLIEKKWSTYFPHVKQNALLDTDGKGGFYSRLAALQGAKGIYYAGGLVGFETVEHTCSFGRELVENSFN